MRYKLAIFDMDGTILNTLEDLYLSTNYALDKHHLPIRTIEEVRCFVGNGIHKLIERAVPKGSSDVLIEEVFISFNEHYKVHCKEHTKPYDGMIELLEKLKSRGILLAVVSNKADYAVKILAKEYFGDLFEVAIGERAGIAKKPAPDSVYEAMKLCDIDKEYCVYIGDSEVDVLTAYNAGIDLIAVSYGFRSEDVLVSHGANIIVDDCDKLYERLCSDV